MPKSKNRKNHKQKSAQRKKKMEDMKKQYQKFYSDVMLKQLELLKEKYEKLSGDTDSNSGTTENE